MNFLLETNEIDITKPIEGMTDVLLYGGQMLLIGMLTVFSVLFVIWFTLQVFKLLFHNAGTKLKKAKPINTEPAPIISPIVASPDEELIAVIAAAIAMAESECGNTSKFRVVSFKRK